MGPIELVEATEPSEWLTPELKELADDASKTDNTHIYRVIDDGREVAFVSLDIWPGESFTILYKMYVSSTLRGQGIGTRTVASVEAFTTCLGRSSVRLVAHPLDNTISEDQLIHWYGRLGYAKDPKSEQGELVKNL